MTVLATFGWWHIPAALDIEHELFHAQPWSEAMFWADLADEERRMFAALDDDQLDGYADLALSAGEAEVLNLAVRTSHQRRGIGAALLAVMLEAAADTEAKRVLLEVRVGNDAAISLYEHNGFQVVGRRPNYYAPGVHAMLMERHG